VPDLFIRGGLLVKDLSHGRRTFAKFGFENHGDVSLGKVLKKVIDWVKVKNPTKGELTRAKTFNAVSLAWPDIV
jgi:hypothetical protein